MHCARITRLGANLAVALCALATLACTTPEQPPGDRRMDTIRLPEPRGDSDFSVERALQQRRSVRSFSAAPLSLEELGQLLWAAQGISGPDGFRTAPSAGALYPLELTVVAGRVAGLHPGVYRYRPSAHELQPLAAGDRRTELARAALGQSWIREAPATIAFGAVEERTTRKYGSRGNAYVRIEVGHAAQNMLLQAQALGLGAAVVGAFDDGATAAVLGTSGEEKPLYLVAVGKAAAPWAPQAP